MNVETSELRSQLLRPAVLAVAASTVLLTAAFVGVAALFTDRLVDGVVGRLPYYVLVFAATFLDALWKLDDRNRDGLTVLVASLGIALGAGLLFGFAVEGFRYTMAHPWNVVDRNLIVYFAAAGIICTALAVWGLRHWREFATAAPSPDVE